MSLWFMLEANVAAKQETCPECEHGLNETANHLRPRCVQLARVRKKTGSFYYHCEWHASHYVKVMLDQIFGENN